MLQITTQYQPSHVVSVGKVTVENIVKQWGKDVTIATGKSILQQCVNLSYSCKWPDRKWDLQDEQRGDFFIKPILSENHTDEVYVNLKINHTLVKFKLDTGSQVNIITEKIFKKIQSGKSLVNTIVKLFLLQKNMYFHTKIISKSSTLLVEINHLYLDKNPGVY